MIHKIGNMWDVLYEAENFVVTTNSFVKRNGDLVMGRGIAQVASLRFPTLAKELGHKINHLGKYGMVKGLEYSSERNTTNIWAFQVKRFWGNKADIDLIKFSLERLMQLSMSMRTNFHLNYPAIGYGGLSRKVIEPILESFNLPDNVYIWRKR